MTFLPINLGSDIKSLLGTGIFLTIYSHITSILYLSWADTGIIGAPSAIVPRKHKHFLVVLDHNDFFSFILGIMSVRGLCGHDRMLVGFTICNRCLSPLKL